MSPQRTNDGLEEFEVTREELRRLIVGKRRGGVKGYKPVLAQVADTTNRVLFGITAFGGCGCPVILAGQILDKELETYGFFLPSGAPTVSSYAGSFDRRVVRFLAARGTPARDDRGRLVVVDD